MTKLLAYIPSPPQGVWHLGWLDGFVRIITFGFVHSLPLRAYALFIIIGIVAALLIGDRRWVARGGEPAVVYDIAFLAVPFGLVGGRLYHVMTDWPKYFGAGGAGPLAVLKIWDGGLGIWGAVALGGVGAWIVCRRRGIPLQAFGDAIAPGIVLAQAIGRIGNYFNQELYGRDTTLPWGLEIFVRRDASGADDSLNGVSTGELAHVNSDGLPFSGVVHPTFLYELIWDVLVFFFLIWVDRRFKIGHGRLFALYVAAYCVGRFFVELMRSDAATLIAGIRINSFTSTFVFIGAMVYFILAPKGREDPATLGGPRAEGEEGKPSAEEEVTEVIPVTDKAKELVGVTAAGGVAAAVGVAAGAGDSKAAEAGDCGAAEAGDGGAAEAGDGGAAEAGDGGAAEAGKAESEVAEQVEPGGEAAAGEAQEPVEETAEGERVEETAEGESAEVAEAAVAVSAPEGEAESEAAEQVEPGGEAQELVEETAEGEPSEKTAEGEPSEKTAEGEPSEKTAEAEPSEKTAEAEPSEKTAEAEPSEEGAAGEPSKEGAAGEPAEVAKAAVADSEPEGEAESEAADGVETAAEVSAEPAGDGSALTVRIPQPPATEAGESRRWWRRLVRGRAGR